jgi:uncharacterized protein YlxW (UPF0749 family)
MTLITEMMERPLDPGYAAAAGRRQGSGLPPATGLRSPLLIIFAVLVGALLGVSALALRAPTTTASKVKSDLVGRIEERRAHADAQTLLIATLRQQIDRSQASALSEQSQNGLTAELLKLELAAGTVPVTGPGMVLTIDDALTRAEPIAPEVNPRAATGPDQGKVMAKDLQMIVNGLWDAGAEAISVNGHRLTTRAAIRSAGAAILVDYRPLARPYVISVIGDPGSLGVEFADNSGGNYLQFVKNNYQIRGDIKSQESVTIPGEPTLSIQNAQPTDSQATGRPATSPATSGPAPSQARPRRSASGKAATSQPATAPRSSAPRTTETSP